MLSIVKTISQRLDNVLRRRLKIQVRGVDDIQEVYESMPFGEDSVPPDGMKAIYAETTRKGKAVLIGYVNVNQLASLAKGEKRIYSTNDIGDMVSAFIIFKNDGTMQVMGTGDFLMRFTPTETAFNQLKTEYDDVVTKLNAIVSGINSWTPVPMDGGAALKASLGVLLAATASTADIAPAKIDEIKTTPVP